MKRISIVLLVLLMLCSNALAEEQGPINLGKAGCYDGLRYSFSLPDGRLVFIGTQANPGNYHKAHARLLILNADLSVNVDYLDPTIGECRYAGAALLPDGRIGAVMSNNPYQEFGGVELHFFTQDGKSAGDPIPLDLDDPLIDGVTPSCIFITSSPPDSDMQRLFLGWNGKLLFRFPHSEWMGSAPQMLETEDGLLLVGCSPDYPCNFKVMKLDFFGNALWENVLPGLLDNGSAEIDLCCPTSDGGFLGWMVDRSLDVWTGDGTWAYALAKFDSEGQVEWMNREINELTQDLRRDDMCEYGGRNLLMMKDGKNLSNGKHMLFWFDPEGNLLEQIPFALEQADETYGLWPVPTESGLWFLYDSRKTHDDIYKEMDSVDMWLVKGPSSLP